MAFSRGTRIALLVLAVSKIAFVGAMLSILIIYHH